MLILHSPPMEIQLEIARTGTENAAVMQTGRKERIRVAAI
jgi:hypothetical protein